MNLDFFKMDIIEDRKNHLVIKLKAIGTVKEIEAIASAVNSVMSDNIPIIENKPKFNINGSVITVCVQCGAVFRGYGILVNLDGSQVCSKECQDEYKHKKIKFIKQLNKDIRERSK